MEMLELRGALNLLRCANRKLMDNRKSEEYDEHHHGVTKAESAQRHKDCQEAGYILSMAGHAVSKQLTAVLGQNKEYTQASALAGE
jgi:hypothetical protein